MTWNVLVGNIGGGVICAIGMVLYMIGVAKGELPFFGWKTLIGYGILVIGAIFAIIFIYAW